MEYSTTKWSIPVLEEGLVFDLDSLYAWLLKLSDGRKARGIRYPLAQLMVMVILAKLGGEDGPKGMAQIPARFFGTQPEIVAGQRTPSGDHQPSIGISS